jgi:hypothetical protein
MHYFKIVLALMLGSSFLFAELSIKNIEKMVRDIRAKRTSKITNTSPVVSPFIVIRNDENRSVMTKLSEKIVKVDFVLGAIVNTTAFIDGSWKKVGDNVGDFQLESITDDHVVLKRKNRTITLYFRKTKNIFTTDKE